MGDMFGMPVGIRAAEADIQGNILKALKMQHDLGAIGMQPAQQRNLEAEARLREAQAQKAEQEAKRTEAVSKRLQELANNPDSPASDPAAFLTTVGNAMLKEGAYDTGSKVLNRASEISKRTTEEATSAARGLLYDTQQKAAQATRVGGLAQAITDQASLDAMRPALEQEGLRDLPQSFEAAAPILAHVARASMSAKDQLAAKAAQLKANEDSIKAKALVQRYLVQNARDSAAARLSAERYLNLVKNGGENSAAALEAKKAKAAADRALAASRKQLRDAKQAGNLPPPDRSLWQVGKAYQSPDGRWGMWDGTSFIPIKPSVDTEDTTDAADEGEEE